MASCTALDGASWLGPHFCVETLVPYDLSCFIHRGFFVAPLALDPEDRWVSFPNKVEANPCIEDHGSHIPCPPADKVCDPEEDLVCVLLKRAFPDCSVDFERLTEAFGLGEAPLLGKRGGVEEEDVEIAAMSFESSSRYEINRGARGRRVEVLLLADW